MLQDKIKDMEFSNKEIMQFLFIKKIASVNLIIDETGMYYKLIKTDSTEEFVYLEKEKNLNLR